MAFAVATALGELGTFLVFGDSYARMSLARMGQASSPFIDLYELATAAVTAMWAYVLAGRMKLCQHDKPGRAALLKAALAVVVLGQLTYASAIAADIAFQNVDGWLVGLLMTPMFLAEWVVWSLMGLIYYGGFAIGANVIASLALSRR